MTVLIDPPLWPAHGTVFSHLVSDTSLVELRSFARACGVPDQAFDLDHYDVPASRYDTLVAAGAKPVEGVALARDLVASGLRIPGTERAGSKRAALLARWDASCPTTADAAAWHDVGEQLDQRWREPHRTYHTAFHLASALDALDLLLADAAEAEAGAPIANDVAWRARIALWFHDAVHDGSTPADEEASAALVHDLLTPIVGAADREEIARLVLVTADHAPEPADLAGCLVSDADLSILGAPSAAYTRYTHQVRAEYAHIPDDLFRPGRAQVLRALLAGGDLYRTPWGATRWQHAATAHLDAELTALSG